MMWVLTSPVAATAALVAAAAPRVAEVLLLSLLVVLLESVLATDGLVDVVFESAEDDFASALIELEVEPLVLVLSVAATLPDWFSELLLLVLLEGAELDAVLEVSVLATAPELELVLLVELLDGVDMDDVSLLAIELLEVLDGVALLLLSATLGDVLEVLDGEVELVEDVSVLTTEFEDDGVVEVDDGEVEDEDGVLEAIELEFAVEDASLLATELLLLLDDGEEEAVELESTLGAELIAPDVFVESTEAVVLFALVVLALVFELLKPLVLVLPVADIEPDVAAEPLTEPVALWSCVDDIELLLEGAVDEALLLLKEPVFALEAL